MTPEEKIKAYDEAIERAKALYDNESSSADTLIACETIFPKLCEPEDEKIRREIIDFLWKEKIFLQEAHSSVENNPKYRFVVDAITWLEKQGDKKPGDKIEPTFKVGDWVVGANNVFQIISLNDELNCYIAVTPNDEEVKIPYYFDDGQGHMCSYHRWVLSDAKVGDVLAFDYGTIVIFKDLYNTTTFHSYCHIEDGLFGVSKDDMPDWWEGEGFHPATKEQRDRLFVKMKEAGYEWDDVKREPKKIEQKPVWNEDRNKELSLSLQIQAYLNTASDELYAKGKSLYSEKRLEDIHKCMLMWQKLHNAYFYRKYDWNEEDDKKLSIMVCAINKVKQNAPEEFETYGKCFSKKDYEEVESWLKSLKDRVQPQPKQEWSEEDERILKDIILDLQVFRDKDYGEAGKAVYQKEIDWLKSIKGRLG